MNNLENWKEMRIASLVYHTTYESATWMATLLWVCLSFSYIVYNWFSCTLDAMVGSLNI